MSVFDDEAALALGLNFTTAVSELVKVKDQRMVPNLALAMGVAEISVEGEKFQLQVHLVPQSGEWMEEGKPYSFFPNDISDED